MWIERKCQSTLRSLCEQFPAVVVTGARQAGKTALVQKVFPDHTYVSLDLPSLAAQAEHSPEAFLKAHGTPLVLDEVQYAPALFRHLKAAIDAEKKKPGRFILTGSQVFPLMQGVSESLAGRCGVLSLYPLSLAEVREAFGDFDENEYILKGGYPELHARPEIHPPFWYASYLATYLERDVRNLLHVGSLRDFDRFLRAVAIRTGQILSYSDIARDVGIAPNTARKWLSALQASGQILLLEPYHRNLGKRLTKSPKLYMCDTGLAAFLMGFETWEALARHPAIGAVWETHVVMQVVKHFASQGRQVPLWFWRTVQGAEVDLLIEQGGRFLAMEAKFTEHPEKETLKGFDALRRFYGDRCLTAGYVVSKTPHPYPLSDHATAIPATMIDEVLAGAVPPYARKRR